MTSLSHAATQAFNPAAKMNKAVVALVVGSLFAGVVPAFLLTQFSIWDFSAPALAVGTIVIFAGFRLGRLAAEPQPRPLQITFYVFTYVWLGITPLLQISARRFPWMRVHTSDDLLTAAAIVWCGLLSYELAMWIAGRRSRKVIQSDSAPCFVTKAKLVTICAVVLCLTVTALALTGLWEFLFSPRTADIGMNSAMAANLALTLRFPIAFVAILAGCMSRDNLSEPRRRRVATGVFIVSALAALVLNNPISTPRVMLGSVVLGMFFSRLRWSRWTNLYLVCGITLGLLAAFPSTDMFRSSLSVNFKDPIDSYVAKGDFDAFQMVANTVTYCRIYGHTDGNQLVGALLFWFPRIYWLQKPVGTGAFVAKELGYKFHNLSCPLWAEAFVDFGALGVMLFLFFYGLFIAKLERLYVNYLAKGWFNLVGIIVAFWAGYQFYFLRGDLQNGLAYCSCFLLCLFFTKIALISRAHTKIPSLAYRGARQISAAVSQ